MPPQVGFIVVDIVVSAVLLYAGYQSYRAWQLLRGSGRSGANYWRLAALGLLFLAADEFFALHEGMGRALTWAGVPTPGHTDHLDDVILVAYVVVAGVISLWYMRELLRVPIVLALLLLGFGVAGFAVLLDNNIQSPTNEIGPHEAVEEFAELAGAALIALGMRVRYFEAIGVPWSRLSPPSSNTVPRFTLLGCEPLPWSERRGGQDVRHDCDTARKGWTGGRGRRGC